MFILEKISQALHKVKSGTNFPAYMQAIKSGGILIDEPHDSTRHTDSIGDRIVFNGKDNLRL